MELPDNHLGGVLTSELSEPVEQCGSQTCLGSPQASVGLFTPLISTTPLPKVKILTTFEKVSLHLPSILVPCQELSTHPLLARGPGHVHGVPIPASAPPHSAWLLVENSQ